MPNRVLSVRQTPLELNNPQIHMAAPFKAVINKFIADDASECSYEIQEIVLTELEAQNKADLQENTARASLLDKVISGAITYYTNKAINLLPKN